MNKMYEAPVAEMIEMKTVTVLMESPAGETPTMESTES